MTLNKRLIERALSEIKNLENKLAKKEDSGWEGSQRRLLLVSDLEKAIKESGE